MSAELSKPRRIEMILRQIDALPTLPAVATRLLSLTASDDSSAREVIELVSADPALTAKVLALCRTADKGIRTDTLTVDKAVVLLGFTAIRNAVLSIKVFEMFGPTDEPARLSHHTVGNGAEEADPGVFDRAGFWTHSLAVAVIAEMIAQGHRARDLHRDEAFVCGLLHDLGKLALDHVLPKSFARVIELADLNQGNIAEFERRVIGIDHHTAGKRLAEMWQLPHCIQDAAWLHGSAYETLPKLDHRRLVGLIGLADLIARKQHTGYSGNHTFKVDEQELIQQLELNPRVVAEVKSRWHEELESRGDALGLNDVPSRELFMRAIQRANQALGRLNQVLDQRSRVAASQGRMLEAISTFHASGAPGRSVQDVLDTVVESARTVLGQGFYAMLYTGRSEPGEQDGWLVSQYSADGRPVHSQLIETPPYAPDLTQLDAQQPVGLNLMGVLPWIADYLLGADDLRDVKLLPLSCGWGTVAVLLHDRRQVPAWAQLQALTSTWGAAIGAAAQHDGARRLGEQLAEANHMLAETQDRLLRQESMARLGEMASGAAHEMNNPLAVISGRSQLLAMTLSAGSPEQKAAQTIFREAHRLSDLITALHLFAEPPQPAIHATDLPELLDKTIKQIKASYSGRDRHFEVYLQVRDKLPRVKLDRDQIEQAINELLDNAAGSNPKAGIQVSVRLSPGEHSVIIQITDDGDGMDPHTLSHAMDPFFSAKPAGRRVGMGLPRARQLITSHGGTLDLSSTPGKGTTATLTLPLDSAA